MLSREAEIVGKRWDFSAEGYDSIIQGEFEGEIPDYWIKLLREYAPCTRGKGLDIGTGPGFFTVLLGLDGWEMTAVDCSENMLLMAEKNAKSAGVAAQFHRMDIHRLGFADQQFDYIVCRNVTWTLYQPETAFREWYRVLKPGGRLLYFDSNWPYREDEEFLRKQREDAEIYTQIYGKPFNTYTGDSRTEEEFQDQVFFRKIWRPDWDLENLPLFGFTNVQVLPRVNEQVYIPKKQLLYRSVPLFMVTADRPAEEQNR